MRLACVEYAPPEQSDDCYNDEYSLLATIQWFSGAAVRTGADDDYQSLVLYALDQGVFWYVNTDAVSSQAWQEVYEVYDVDLWTGVRCLISA